jgi:hypothetical protein
VLRHSSIFYVIGWTRVIKRREKGTRINVLYNLFVSKMSTWEGDVGSTSGRCGAPVRVRFGRFNYSRRGRDDHVYDSKNRWTNCLLLIFGLYQRPKRPSGSFWPLSPMIERKNQEKTSRASVLQVINMIIMTSTIECLLLPNRTRTGAPQSTSHRPYIYLTSTNWYLSRRLFRDK